ncbi:MAG TPA: ABC transporter ATP-binding protein [Candidatus Limiplasma sp.]|nr:ABC transporter ATP-binding protein [Candidatus Limiplasma sp.]
MSSIKLIGLRKDFGQETVIPDLNLEIHDGSFTVLVGPSGCGKSTTLRIIAGLEKPTAGEILIDGKNVADVPPGKRNLAMVFQNYALYPNMTVRSNIEFGLKNKGIVKKKRDALINEVCEIVGLSPYMERKPGNLSGGQRQRVALARAMVKKPRVFLMDEPLSNLDAKLRASMRIELIELHKRLQTTFVYVTHDQVEAMSMGDSIVLMNEGVIMQHSSPKAIYHDPQNVFTARFIGTPPMNVFEGMLEDFSVGFRPEKVLFEKPEDVKHLVINGKVITREQLGATINYSVETKYGMMMVHTDFDTEQTKCTFYVPVSALFLFAKDGTRCAFSDTQLKTLLKL